jgi:hypothetical protein
MILALIAAGLCAAALAHGFFVRRVEIYGQDRKTVVGRLGGGELVRSAVRGEITRDPTEGKIVWSQAPDVECPT